MRDVLFLAADGRCAACGQGLTTGWHADHVHPHSLGGVTDVVNGQALCASCNLKKGANMLELRPWQSEALRVIRDADVDQRDFLICATPGAGKTVFATTAARAMLENNIAQRVVVVAPTDALREQWADEAAAAGLQLVPVRTAEDHEHRGYDGCVVTFQQLAAGAHASLARRACRRPTIAIVDEAHHVGDQQAWGAALQEALEPAKRRLLLSGTPWRRDKRQPIPYVAYSPDGLAAPDYDYGYGRAVSDGVCRRIEFLAYDGSVRWLDASTEVSANLGADLLDDDVAPALEAAFDPRHDWMPGLLASAVAGLEELRRDIPDAGGLVVANTVYQAREYAAMLRDLTGEEAVTVLSEDAGAKERIDVFRRGRQRWMVAVKMVSEGVDVKRLAVGVYASKIRTPLFFRQVVGRFVRVRPDEDINARLYLPAVPSLMRYAEHLETELLHQLRQDEEETRKARVELEGSQRTFELRQSLSASPAEYVGSVYGGDNLPPQLMQRCQDTARELNIPSNLAVNLAPLLRQLDRPVATTVTVEAPGAREKVEQPLHRQVRQLKAEINKMAGKVAHAAGLDKQQVNYKLLELGHPSRAAADYDQLVAIRAALLDWYSKLQQRG